MLNMKTVNGFVEFVGVENKVKSNSFFIDKFYSLFSKSKNIFSSGFTFFEYCLNIVFSSTKFICKRKKRKEGKRENRYIYIYIHMLENHEFSDF